MTYENALELAGRAEGMLGAGREEDGLLGGVLSINLEPGGRAACEVHLSEPAFWAMVREPGVRLRVEARDLSGYPHAVCTDVGRVRFFCLTDSLERWSLRLGEAGISP